MIRQQHQCSIVAVVALSFLMPFLFAAVHGPLDEKYIVEQLGGGCFPGFNANSLAAILFFSV